jgi:hypothetical protein
MMDPNRRTRCDFPKCRNTVSIKSLAEEINKRGGALQRGGAYLVTMRREKLQSCPSHAPLLKMALRFRQKFLKAVAQAKVK